MTPNNGTFSDITSNSSLNAEAQLPTTINDTAGDIQVLIDAAKGFATQAKAPSTRRAYQSDWRAFTSWCRLSGFSELPTRSEVVVMYITHLASSGRRVATISRVLVLTWQSQNQTGLQVSAIRWWWPFGPSLFESRRNGFMPCLAC